jgi:L-lysine exporter family protein LysE/ArgO
MRFGGAAFIGIYGFGAARRAYRGTSGLVATAQAPASRKRVLLACLAFTFLNPHVYLDTMVLLGTLSTRYPGGGRWAFAGGVGLASLTWFTLLGYGGRFLAPIFRRPLAWRVLDAITAAFMLVLCVLLVSRPL